MCGSERMKWETTRTSCFTGKQAHCTLHASLNQLCLLFHPSLNPIPSAHSRSHSCLTFRMSSSWALRLTTPYMSTCVKCHTCLRLYAGLVYDCVPERVRVRVQSPHVTQKHPWPGLIKEPLKIVGHLGSVPTTHKHAHIHTDRLHSFGSNYSSCACSPSPPSCTIHSNYSSVFPFFFIILISLYLHRKLLQNKGLFICFLFPSLVLTNTHRHTLFSGHLHSSRIL